jgi:hypothetical protein
MRTIANELTGRVVVSGIVAERLGQNDEEDRLTRYLEEKVDEISEIENNLADAMRESNVNFGEENREGQIVNTAGMTAVILWVQGKSFQEPVKDLDISEGG